MRRRRGIIRGNFSKLGLLCLALIIGMGSLTVGYPAWMDTLSISGTVTTGYWELGGTPGFWHNCIYDPALDSEHYSGSQTNIWLNYIDSGGGLVTASEWLVPDIVDDGFIDTGDMLAIFVAGAGGTDEEKFLRHYLATRLDVEAERLFLTTWHHFSSYDPGNYLGLGGQGTLQDIIDAIEDRYPDNPTDPQFLIMKDICDALNNLDI